MSSLVEDCKTIGLRSFPESIEYIKSNKKDRKESTSVSNITYDVRKLIYLIKSKILTNNLFFIWIRPLLTLKKYQVTEM